MHKLNFKKVFMLYILLVCISVLAADENVSNTLNRLKSNNSNIIKYEADMTITSNTKVKKAHIYYLNGDLRVEVISENNNIVLHKGENKYKWNEETNKFEESILVTSDFFVHEPLRGLVTTIANLEYIKDKTINEDDKSIVITCNSFLGPLILMVDKEKFTLVEIVSYIDSDKKTETLLEYSKIGTNYFLTRKTYSDLDQEVTPNIIVELDNIEINGDFNEALFKL